MSIDVRKKRNEPGEKLIKRFNRKVDDSGILRELRDRRFFEKPSVKKRKKTIRARIRARKATRENR